jgi:hypothetical protein
VQRSLKVLFIAYHFPPAGAIGGVRPYQLARHLPEFGVEPWILTVEPQHADQLDAAFQPQGLEPSRIWRTRVETTIADRVRQLWRRTMVQETANAARPAEPSLAQVFRGSSRSRLIRDWGLSWLDYTDGHIGWFRAALRRAELGQREVGFDVVASTSPPRVGALVARELSRRHGVPWLMDLRDPWHLKEWDPPGSSALVARHKARLFSKCVDDAHIIVHNTERLRRHTCSLKPSAEKKAYCVPNGYEPEWATPSDFGTRAFRVGYYGNIMGRRSSTTFLEGLRAWLDAGTAEPSLSVRFVGSGFEGAHSELGRLGLSEIVSVHPPVPRTQVRRLIGEDFVLLSFANAQPLQVPGKTYDYLATGRRILAVTEHEGATADVLSSLEGCAIANSPSEVASAIEAFRRAFDQGAEPRIERSAFMAEADYRNRAEQFAKLLWMASGKSGASSVG